MNRRTEEIVEGLRHCMEQPDFCDTACPMYGRCIGEGEDMFRSAAAQLEETARHLDAVLEAIEGRRVIYFRVQDPARMPPLPEEGRIADIRHDERRYIPLIDRMAWGLAIYSRELSGDEITRCGLIRAPRD